MTSHALPEPFTNPNQPLELIAQGAEALLYKTVLFSSTTCALKVRPSKAWRHPKLDRQLTRQRILAEARVLVKCLQKGIRVPAVLSLDWEAGWLGLEWIGGKTVKQAIRTRTQASDLETVDEDELKLLMRRIGHAVARLHEIGIVHGDLTTSNMMLHPKDQETVEEGSLAGEIVLIDFGLAVQTVHEEERAVDLYVLERAFGSTHPKEEGFFDEVLQGYAAAFKGSKATLRRLEDVRQRGRKKSMLG
ncbi:hypothetical protein AMS68_001651 [Peltaster fructicola]|uniref:EKC/KEOPS complex subunit BUD32 n=1 Tax=Peltaster fructicola TaxID=286661 RepID=A0A6H0XN33_9PEZI|nr:hypothetical protein AMS68_001651 [Peltaster fructicola]